MSEQDAITPGYAARYGTAVHWGASDRVECPRCKGYGAQFSSSGWADCLPCHGAGFIHPIIRAMIVSLPPPDTVWPAAERTAWLKWCAASLDLLYKVEPAPEGPAPDPQGPAEQDDPRGEGAGNSREPPAGDGHVRRDESTT